VLNFGDDRIIYNGFITDVVLITDIRKIFTGFWILVYVPQNGWEKKLKINRKIY
jgi:hypothetical protein